MTKKEPTDPFNLESLIGQANQIVITHGASKAGKTFANISAFLPARTAPATAPESKDIPY